MSDLDLLRGTLDILVGLMPFTVLPPALGLVALLASRLPVRRATRVNPQDTLTME